MESLEGPDVRSRGVGKVGAGEEGDLAKQKEAGISCMESLRQPPYETRLNTDKCVNGFFVHEEATVVASGGLGVGDRVHKIRIRGLKSIVA